MLASLFILYALLTLIFMSVGISVYPLLPWLMKAEKRQINYPETVTESTFGKLSKMADQTERKMVLHTKHPVNYKQSHGLGMSFASCTSLRKGLLPETLTTEKRK